MSSSTVSALQTSLLAYLRGLRHTMEKAHEHMATKDIGDDALLGVRLIADMAPLAFQVQVACELAARGTARLAGADIPSYSREEKTVDDLLATIDQTIDAIGKHDATAIEAGLEREHEVAMGPTSIAMSGLTYLFEFLLPNFYFHCTTAYGLLRANGVPLGKQDFMAGVSFMPTQARS